MTPENHAALVANQPNVELFFWIVVIGTIAIILTFTLLRMYARWKRDDAIRRYAIGRSIDKEEARQLELTGVFER